MGIESTPRFCSRSLPPYKHIPGQTPHPIRDPAGHSYDPSGALERDLPDLNRYAGLDHPEFLYGLDLFNAGYWWESHEVMEAFWHAAGMGTPAAHVLQAIIQCAAAHLKALTGQEEGASKLFEMAEDHIHQAEDTNLGLDLIGLLAETGAYITRDSDKPAQLVPLSYSGTGRP